MSRNLHQRQIARAEELATRYPSSAEMLRFFVPVARFQNESYCTAEKVFKNQEQNVRSPNHLRWELRVDSLDFCRW